MRDDMTVYLDDSLEDVFSRLSPVMISQNWNTILRKTVDKLPPVVRILLECRLSANQPQVDLSQSFLVDDLPVLNAFLDSSLFLDKSWESIHSFIRQWSAPDSLVQRYLNGIWLEFDLLSGSGQYQTYFTAYLDCRKTVPDGAIPNYIGFMLSREPVTVRAQFSGIHKGRIGPFLTDIGLKSSPESLQSTINIAYRFFHRNVLCIDLSPTIVPRIGLELFPGQYIPEAFFDEFLDVLVGMGLCSKLKRKAIKSYSGLRNPVNSKTDWPDHLILQSLQKPTDYFSVMDRRINHFKLVCQPDRDIEAKAYLAFDHWTQIDNN